MVKEPGWKKRVSSELQELSITIIYLWVLLSVFVLHRKIILSSYNISYSAQYGFPLINALILAKFMWLGEVLHVGKMAAGKALLYSTPWKSAVFTVLLILCHLLEETLRRLWHGQSFTESISETIAHPRDLFVSGVLVFVVLNPFFFAKGLIEILGKDEIKRLLLRSHSTASTLPAKT